MSDIKKFAVFGAILILCVNSAPLTPIENLQRSKECGSLHLPQPNVSQYGEGGTVTEPIDWMVEVKCTVYRRTPSTTGTFISNRHIVTSTQSVLMEMGNPAKIKWSFSDLEFQPDCNGTQYMEVERAKAKKMTVVHRNNSLPVAKAFLFWMCPPFHDYSTMFAPLILELETPVPDVKFPCFVDNETETNDVDVLMYGNELDVNFVVKALKYRSAKTSKIASNDEKDKRWLTVPKYTSVYDRGGPMVKSSVNETTIIGIGANPAQSEGWSTYFYALQFFVEPICESTGVCPPDESLTTVPIVATTATTAARSSTRAPQQETDSPAVKVEVEDEGPDDVDQELFGDLLVHPDYTKAGRSLWEDWTLFIALIAVEIYP